MSDTLLEEAAARIEALEAALLDAATRIEALKPEIHKSIDDWRERGERIEALEAAMQKIADGYLDTAQYVAIARAALHGPV